MESSENGQQQMPDFLTVSYDPCGQGTALHAAVIPPTDNYSVALASAKEALRKYFPSGSSNKSRWLAMPVETKAGLTWAEIAPETFPNLVKREDIEFRLCEGHRHVNILPLGNEGNISYKFKMMTIGSMGVGKSMMLQYFTKPEGQRSFILPSTINPQSDISTRFVTTQGARLKVELWDTVGQEQFRSITKNVYRGTNGVLLVYNVTERSSFLACESWLQDIKVNMEDDVPIMLVGNQIDLDCSRTVRTNEGEEFALNNGLLFTEISAKKGTGVEYAFQTLVDVDGQTYTEIFSRIKSKNKLSEYKVSTETRSETVKLDEAKNPKSPNKGGSLGVCCS